MKVLVFDIWGEYAHFKKIYATTSALTYAIPTKPTIYGFIGALIGLDKEENIYLKSFSDKNCLVGIGVLKPLIFQRLGINLKAELGRKKEGSPPKPTMMEFIHRPKYRLFVTHKDEGIYTKLKKNLENHSSFYTPTLGLANLLASFKYHGEFDTEWTESNKTIAVHSVIDRKNFIAFDDLMFDAPDVGIIEQSMYAVEMDTDRNVTERDDILLERKGNPIFAKVKTYYPINGQNICLF